MDQGVKAALKWLAAGALMVLIAALAIPMAFDALRASVRIGGDEPTVPPTEPAQAGPEPEGSLQALADFSVRAGAVRQADEPLVAIGGEPGDGVVFAFPAIEQPVDCLATVTLGLHYDGDTGGELIAVPADVEDPAALADGDALGEGVYGDAPRISATAEQAGPVSWDVTELYRGQMVGEAAAGAFAVAVVPPDVDGDRRVRFVSSEGPEEQRPVLQWTADPQCPGAS